MGITPLTLEAINDVFPALASIRFSTKHELRMAELGDQEFFLFPGGDPVFNGVQMHFAKQFWESLGVDHVSFDWHGRNGVVQHDMTQPVPKEYVGVFDVLTNFGFSEHVCDQYACFANMHDMVKPGGLFISENPGQPLALHHETLPYYTPAFFEQLCKAAEYELLDVRTYSYTSPPLGLVTFAAYRKGDGAFQSAEAFAALPIGRNG